MAKDSKNKILKVAIKEFANKGYNSASTRDICANAGVNISSIAYYFKSKRGLYEEVLKIVVEKLNAYLGDIVSEFAVLKQKFPAPKESYEMLKRIFHKFIEGICIPELPHDITTIYLLEYVRPSDSFHIFEDGLNKVYMPIVRELLVDANEGRVAEAEANLYAFILFSQIFNLAVRKDGILKIMNWKNYSKGEIETLCKVIDNGLII